MRLLHRFRRALRERVAVLRERMRGDPANPPRLWVRRHRWRLAGVAIALLGVAVLDAWLASCGFQRCPTGAEIRAYRPTEGGRILDRQGRLLGHLSPVRRVNVELADVPAHVRQAFVAVEDRRFYSHRGLDLQSVPRAVVRNVSALGVREGFSTITMQVARNAFVARSFSRRGVRRKLIEMRIARLLERELTKDEILGLYLNVIYLGSGSFGVEAASRAYFGKSVKQLNVAEGALLAALPKGPSAYTPRRDPRRAKQRRDLVLGLMVDVGYLSADRARAAQRVPLGLAREAERPRTPSDSYALDAVRAIVDSVLTSRKADLAGDLTVHTTLDLAAQRSADRAVSRRAIAIERSTGRRGRIEGAMVALDPRTGDIRALVGGREYERGNFNRALAARRQPGSAFKPFVYAAGLAAGFSPASMVDDEPVEVQQGNDIWTPANYGESYEGQITLRRALMQSANAATVRLSRAVGETKVVDLAHRHGIRSVLDPVPAIALGALEVTPLELVAAYAPFANGGYRVTPRLVRRVTAADGSLLWSQETERQAVMDPVDAYQMTAMLRAAVDHGTGRALREWGVTGPVAGKTGTTNNGADVWFVGYTPTVVAGFWFGYDTPRQIAVNASGGGFAAPAWAEWEQQGWRERDDDAWSPPAGMVSRVIDPTTGELAGERCPTTGREWFRAGLEPREPCRWHQAPFEPLDPFADEMAEVGRKVERAFKRIFRF